MTTSMAKILAIDDNRDNLIGLKAIISDAFPNADLFTATNGFMGIEIAVANDPDVILLDIFMPEIDGFEVCRRLKQDERVNDIPVVFLTAEKGERGNSIKALEVGAEAFLSKPFEESELIAQIKAMVKIKAANRQKKGENERLANLVAERTRELEQSQREMRNLLDELNAEIESRKGIERELRESEEKFRNIFEYHTAVKLIIDSETGSIINANCAAEKYYGWSKEQLLNMKIHDINTLSSGNIRNAIEKANKGEQDNFEFKHRLADGTIRDVEVFTGRIEVKGKFLLQSIVHDITERNQAKAAIGKSEARLKRAEIASLSGNWECHLDTQTIVASEGAVKLYGVDRDVFDYAVIRKIPLEEYRPKLDEALRKLIEEDQPYDIEFKIKTVDTGEIKDIHSVAIYDKEQRILFGIIQDITDRKLTEEKLKDQKRFFEQMFSQSSVSTQILDKDGWCKRINPKLSEIFGVKPEHIEGKLYNILKDEGIIQGGVLPHLEKVFKEGKTAEWDVFFDIGIAAESQKIEVAEKKKVWYHNWAYPIFDENDRLSHVIVQHTDITDRKQAEESLIKSETRLRELIATKDKFFTIIAHDLRGPFNSILGLSNMLVEQARENDYEGMAEYAEIIQNSSQHAMNLLKNLLEWSRSQTGRIEFSPEYIDVLTQIVEVEKLLIEAANRKSINIKKSIPRNTLVFADKAMLGIILRNFISNAIKFSHPGGEIQITVEKKNPELIIAVEDFGVGIKKQALEKLFRIDQTFSTMGTQNEVGTGLGLILCKEFVEKHGGRIWVESEAGKGSKFSFSIPKK